jgi:hypothetical protein
VDIKIAQTILRHKKLPTMAEIYTHAVQQNQIAAQGRILRPFGSGQQYGNRVEFWVGFEMSMR